MRQGSWDRKLFEDFSSVYNDTREAIRVVHDNESPFSEFITVERTPIIELNSSYGFSALRDLKNETDGGTVTNNGVEFVVSSGTTANGFAEITSAEVGRYIPGYSAEIGVGVRIPTLPTGNQYAEWGGTGRDGNGVFFGVDATGYYVKLVKSSVENKVYQDNWNKDKLDGTGQSGFTIDNTKGLIYQIDFTWYGYGPITFSVIATVNDAPRIIKCHTFSGFTSTSVDSPNFRVSASVSNGGDTEDFTVYVGGRQYSILGRYIPKFRFTGDFRNSVSTTTTVKPLVTFRRKTGFGDRSIKVEGFDIIASGQPHIIEVRINATLTGASFSNPTNHTVAETAVESDTSATGITGGLVIWQQLIPAGTGNQAELSGRQVDVDVPNGQAITLCARTISATGTATSEFRIREEW